jgi:hypothetical protein
MNEQPAKESSAQSEESPVSQSSPPEETTAINASGNRLKDKATHRLRNLTPERLQIEFSQTGRKLSFAPLAERDLNVSSVKEEIAYDTLELRGLISTKQLTEAEKTNLEGIGSVIFTFAFMYYVFAIAITEDHPWLRVYVLFVLPLVVVLIGVVFAIGKGLGWTNLRRFFQQTLTLMLVLATGSGLTALEIYFFADGQRLLEEGPSTILLGRILQLVFITIASLLPALLYFLFDRNRLSTLRLHFERQIFRFDPTVHTLPEVYAKYGDQLDELYGRDPDTARSRYKPGTRWPIWVCTLVLTIGWILTLHPIESILPPGPQNLLSFFTPFQSAVTFGFLGAYFFSIFSISRRYTRGDLQPKAYSHIVVRVLIVVLMAWVLQTMIDDTTYLLGVVFLIGVLPETFWTVFNEVLRNQLLGRVFSSLKEKDPLTNLEGIDPYDRARLAEEGVTNVESLAHHDLIDLMLTTRIPVPRLVDWLDQAILYLHTPYNWQITPPVKKNAIGGEENENKDISSDSPIKPITVLQHLKTYGIRTATDFISTFEASQQRGGVEYLNAILGETNGSSVDTKTSRSQLLYETILDDEWLYNIRFWRKSIEVKERKVLIKPDGAVEEI